MPTITQKISHADRTRLWWVGAVALRSIAAKCDRLRQEAGGQFGECPFTLAELETMEAGIVWALDAVAETAPAA